MEARMMEGGVSYHALVVYGASVLGLALIALGLVIPGRPLAALGVALCVFAATRCVLSRLARLETRQMAVFELGQESVRLKRV